MIPDLIAIVSNFYFLLAIVLFSAWGFIVRFPVLFLNLVRKSIVLLFILLNFWKWHIILTRITLLLYYFSLDSIVYLVFRKGDEWIDGFIWGFASAIWLGFLLYPIIYEVTHWKLNK